MLLRPREVRFEWEGLEHLEGFLEVFDSSISPASVYDRFWKASEFSMRLRLCFDFSGNLKQEHSLY